MPLKNLDKYVKTTACESGSHRRISMVTLQSLYIGEQHRRFIMLISSFILDDTSAIKGEALSDRFGFNKN